MRQVVKVQIYPDAGQYLLLLETLELSNKVANEISKVRFAKSIRKRIDLQKATYHLSKDSGLGSQLRILAGHKVHGAYESLWANIKAGNLGDRDSKRYKKATGKPISFRQDAAQPFDDRCLSWDYSDLSVRIWTTGGRQKMVYKGSSADLKRLQQYRGSGQSDLVYREGKWYLYATITTNDPRPPVPKEYLGIDLGINNLATDSKGHNWCGDHVKRLRAHHLRLRSKLQKKQTKSAKRLLKKRSLKESRFATDINHQISKQVVQEAKRTGCGIALEDLGGIRDRARQRGPKQRAVFHSWAFAQLGQFIVYKAQRAGVQVVLVDPAYTSQQCNQCKHVDKKNRPSQAVFHCQKCGHKDHADKNAAKNIADRGKQNPGCKTKTTVKSNTQTQPKVRQPAGYGAASSALQGRDI